MDVGKERGNKLDAVLGVILRVLLALVFALAGASLMSNVPSWGGAPAGVAIGLLVIAIALLKEKAIVGFLKEYKSTLALAGLILYVAVLGLAAYSELLNLGWFNWLSS